MNAEYLDCSMGGSYYINCVILEKRKCESKDSTSLDRILRKEPEHLGQDGYVITYTDDHDTVTEWVPEEYVRLPKVSEWIGL